MSSFLRHPIFNNLDFESLDSQHHSNDVDESRQARVQELARQYVQSQPLFVLTATLTGPFPTQWENPWEKSHNPAAEERKERRAHFLRAQLDRDDRDAKRVAQYKSRQRRALRLQGDSRGRTSALPMDVEEDPRVRSVDPPIDSMGVQDVDLGNITSVVPVEDDTAIVFISCSSGIPAMPKALEQKDARAAVILGEGELSSVVPHHLSHAQSLLSRTPSIEHTLGIRTRKPNAVVHDEVSTSVLLTIRLGTPHTPPEDAHIAGRKALAQISHSGNLATLSAAGVNISTKMPKARVFEHGDALTDAPSQSDIMPTPSDSDKEARVVEHTGVGIYQTHVAGSVAPDTAVPTLLLSGFTPINPAAASATLKRKREEVLPATNGEHSEGNKTRTPTAEPVSEDDEEGVDRSPRIKLSINVSPRCLRIRTKSHSRLSMSQPEPSIVERPLVEPPKSTTPPSRSLPPTMSRTFSKQHRKTMERIFPAVDTKEQEDSNASLKNLLGGPLYENRLKANWGASTPRTISVLKAVLHEASRRKKPAALIHASPIPKPKQMPKQMMTFDTPVARRETRRRRVTARKESVNAQPSADTAHVTLKDEDVAAAPIVDALASSGLLILTAHAARALPGAQASRTGATPGIGKELLGGESITTNAVWENNKELPSGSASIEATTPETGKAMPIGQTLTSHTTPLTWEGLTDGLFLASDDELDMSFVPGGTPHTHGHEILQLHTNKVFSAAKGSQIRKLALQCQESCDTTPRMPHSFDRLIESPVFQSTQDLFNQAHQGFAEWGSPFEPETRLQNGDTFPRPRREQVQAGEITPFRSLRDSPTDLPAPENAESIPINTQALFQAYEITPDEIAPAGKRSKRASFADSPLGSMGTSGGAKGLKKRGVLGKSSLRSSTSMRSPTSFSTLGFAAVNEQAEEDQNDVSMVDVMDTIIGKAQTFLGDWDVEKAARRAVADRG